MYTCPNYVCQALIMDVKRIIFLTMDVKLIIYCVAGSTFEIMVLLSGLLPMPGVSTAVMGEASYGMERAFGMTFPDAKCCL